MRELMHDAVVVVHGHAKLVEVVLAMDPVGGFAHLLYCRYQEGDQDADDCEDDEHLDQGKASALVPHRTPPSKGAWMRGPGREPPASRVLRKSPRNPPP